MGLQRLLVVALLAGFVLTQCDQSGDLPAEDTRLSRAGTGKPDEAALIVHTEPSACPDCTEKSPKLPMRIRSTRKKIHRRAGGLAEGPSNIICIHPRK